MPGLSPWAIPTASLRAQKQSLLGDAVRVFAVAEMNTGHWFRERYLEYPSGSNDVAATAMRRAYAKAVPE